MQKKLFNKYTAIAITDVGLIRQHNEDSILIDEKLGLLVVADGMGGHQAGEVASFEAIKIIQQMLLLQQKMVKNESWLSRSFNKFKPGNKEITSHTLSVEKALVEANNHVYQLNVEHNAGIGSGMGTTIAGCQLISTDTMLVFHIGDSRVYRFRDKKLQRLSKDHSVLQEWHDNGCEGDRPKANVILRALGPYPQVAPDIQCVKIRKGDSFLICSDGLTDMLDDQTVENAMQGISTAQLPKYSQSLLDLALEQGGKDNVSVVLMVGE